MASNTVWQYFMMSKQTATGVNAICSYKQQVLQL